ncbi:DNA-binding domain of ModE [Methylophaga thiooxydans]|uniref:DNA-binding domain of ModE n=1 Tax=Methylophaga thiooxydans TaxID=392484 RepID=A0A0A0BJ13_9GAMM|nr:winged helix-turn-helix domain-containing protein [Methylophaga thiooxydans]KGM07966.1 DNA-binding domain of ModE [Methylophaga thiooxydans]
MAKSVSIKIRFHNNDIVAIGPGKADLLEAIETHGSISAAGRAMGMSYKRSWDLVNAMNTSFKHPLVHTSKGGSHGGGATVTAFGQEILQHYRQLEQKVHASIEAEAAAITALLDR